MKHAAFLSLMRDRRGNAAAETALIVPLLLILMFGAVELGNYFMNEHALVKGVRDGARYAARQSFANYSACTVPTTISDDTKLLVRKGTLDSSDPDRLPNWSGVGASCSGNPPNGCFAVTMTCPTTADGQTMSGIYKNLSGAPVVTVTVNLPYQPILGAFGFTGGGMHLNATSQAAVTGL